MRRNIDSVEYDMEWTAWDCNVPGIYRQPPKVRRRLRRRAKRVLKQKYKLEAKNFDNEA